MKHRLRDLLACPECGAHPLDLTILETQSARRPELASPRCSSYCSWQAAPLAGSGGAERPCPDCYSVEITQAILHCVRCEREYPVVDGIPRFNPDAQNDFAGFFQSWAGRFRRRIPVDLAAFRRLQSRTKKSFGYQWLRYQVTDHQENRRHFYRRTATRPGALPGQLFFEAGCGMGRYLKVIADEPDAEVVGLDLSLAVNRAYAENRDAPFVHVVQGDILKLPLRPGIFDHVYSIGVLHHTPDTRQAFRSIVPLAKPGGRVSVWVYHVWKPPELRGPKAVHAALKGAISEGLRAITTRLPLGLLHYLCYIAVPLGWLQRQIGRLPAPLRVVLAPFTLIACSSHAEWRVRLLDTFDWYSPRYQWKHTVPEVEGWFREAGLTDISTEGFAVTVRGARPPARGESAVTSRESPRP